MRDDVDQPFLLQADQRLPHRGLADAEPGRELGAGQDGAGRQGQGDDRLAQLVIGDLGGRAARPERRQGRDAGGVGGRENGIWRRHARYR